MSLYTSTSCHSSPLLFPGNDEPGPSSNGRPPTARVDQGMPYGAASLVRRWMPLEHLPIDLCTAVTATVHTWETSHLRIGPCTWGRRGNESPSLVSWQHGCSSLGYLPKRVTREYRILSKVGHSMLYHFTC